MGIIICVNCEQTIGNLEESFLYKNHVVCKKCNDLLKNESHAIEALECNVRKPKIPITEKLPEKITGNPEYIPSSCVNIEVARNSWRNVPDQHVALALKNLNDYDAQVRDTIIQEATSRFGETFVLETLNSPIQENEPQKHYGGIGRLGYFLGTLGIGFICGLIEGVASGSPETSSLCGLIMLVFSFVLAVNRLHNIGTSGWWSVLMLIPIVGFFVLIPCLVFPEGFKDTKKLDTAGKIILGILIGLIVLVIVIVIVAAIVS